MLLREPRFYNLHKVRYPRTLQTIQTIVDRAVDRTLQTIDFQDVKSCCTSLGLDGKVLSARQTVDCLSSFYPSYVLPISVL